MFNRVNPPGSVPVYLRPPRKKTHLIPNIELLSSEPVLTRRAPDYNFLRWSITATGSSRRAICSRRRLGFVPAAMPYPPVIGERNHQGCYSGNHRLDQRQERRPEQAQVNAQHRRTNYTGFLTVTEWQPGFWCISRTGLRSAKDGSALWLSGGV